MKRKPALAFGGMIGKDGFKSSERSPTVERQLEHFTQAAIGDGFREVGHPSVFGLR